jgi:hypothetical protein
MTLYIFTFSARKLPGEPLPNAEERTVIVHIAGKTQEEAERFMEVFETIRPAKVAQSTNSELNHETRSTGSEQAH